MSELRKVEAGPQWQISRAEQVRSAMGPEMCAAADALRTTFGAKIVWLETKAIQMGTEPEWGVPTTLASSENKTGEEL